MIMRENDECLVAPAGNDGAKFTAMSNDTKAAKSQEDDQTSINRNDDDDDEVLIINYTDGFGEEEFPQPVVIKQEIIMKGNDNIENEGCLDMEGEQLSEIKLEEPEFCDSELKQKVDSLDWSEGPNLECVEDADDTEEADVSEFQIEMPMLSPTEENILSPTGENVLSPTGENVLSPMGENPTGFEDAVSENITESSMEDLKPLHLIDDQDENSGSSEPPQIEPKEVIDFSTEELCGYDSSEPNKRPSLKVQLVDSSSPEPKKKPPLKVQLDDCDNPESEKELLLEVQLDDCDTPEPEKEPPLKTQAVNKGKEGDNNPKKKLVCYRCNFRTDCPKNLELHKTNTCPELILEDNDADDTSSEVSNCDTCDFVAKSYAGIVSHVRGHQNNEVKEGPSKCSECEFKTNRKKEMVLHRSRCHDKEKTEEKSKYKCRWCSYQSYSKTGLTLHRLMHTQQNQKIYTCYSCPFRSTIGSLMNHVRVKHQQKKLKLLRCSECDYTNYSPSCFQMHLVEGCKPAEDGDPVVINVDQMPEFTLLECAHCSFVTKSGNTLKSHTNRCKWNARHFFTCPCCPYKATPWLMMRHMKRAHSDSPLSANNATFQRGHYVCAKCGAKFRGAWQLQLHISRNKGLDRCLQTAEADDKYANDDAGDARQCGSCSYSAQNELDLAIHEITFHCDAQMPRCKYCPFKGPKSQVVIHMKEAHDCTNMTQCSLNRVGRPRKSSGMVFERFSPEKELNEDEDQDYEAPLSKKAKTKPPNKNSSQSSPSNKTLEGELRAFQTLHKRSLSKHRLMHGQEDGTKVKRPPRLRCRCCDYATHFKHMLSRHELMCGHGPPKHHTTTSHCDSSYSQVGAKANKRRSNFRCNYCNYATPFRHNLLRHRMKCKPGSDSVDFRVGRKTPTFRCSQCNYASRFKNDLLKHELTNAHSEKSFKCDSCDFQSNHYGALYNHKLMHRPGKDQNFKCEFCELQYGSKRALYAHIIVHGLKVNENEVIFTCDLCGYESRSKGGWYKHLQTQTHKFNAEKSATVAEAAEEVEKSKSADVIYISLDDSDSDSKPVKQPARGRGRPRKVSKSKTKDDVKIKKEVLEDEAGPATEQNNSDLEDLLDYIEISETDLPNDQRKVSKPAEGVKKSPKVKLKKHNEVKDSRPAEENVVQKCPYCFFKCNNKGILWDHFSACHIPSN